MFAKKTKIVLLFTLILSFIFFSFSYAAQISIIPEPKKTSSKNFNLILNNRWSIVVDKANKKDIFTARELQRYLKEKFNILSSIKDTTIVSLNESIIIANPKKNRTVMEIFSKKKLVPDTKLGQEGYLLEAYPDNLILISANSPNGLFYGMQTLKQLLFKEGNQTKIKATKIEDWPDNKMRGVHFLNLTNGLDGMKEKIDWLASLKINTIILQEKGFWWLDQESIQAGCKNRSILKEIFTYAQERNIELIPELQCFGASNEILYKDPNIAEGIFVEDEPFKFINNIAMPVMAKKVEVKNASFEINSNNDRIPDNWKFYSNPKEFPKNFWELDDSTAHSGKYSVRMNVKGTSNPLVQVCNEVKSDAVYSLSFFAKKTPESSGGYSIAMRISQWDKNGKFIVENYMPVKNTTNNWKKHVLNFVTQPNCAFIHISASISNGYGKAWFDDIELKRLSGSLINVIRTESTNLVIISEDRKTRYIEVKDYNIIDGELKVPYNVSSIPSKILRTKNSRIKPGETVLISYDFVVRFNPYIYKMPYCPSEPRVYNIIFSVLEDVIESFQPNYVSIGHDEIYGMNRDSRCKKRNMNNAELLAEDVNRLNDYIHNINPDIKMIMWDDMFNPWHNGGVNSFQMIYGGQPGKTSNAINLISKDIILLIWWYDSIDRKGKVRNSPDYFESQGFQYLVSPWYNEENIRQWLEIIKGRQDCLGVIDTTWTGVTEECCWKGIEPVANFSWNLNGEF